VNETTKLPDGRKCPAFALAVRNTTVTDTNNEENEDRNNKNENKNGKKNSRDGKKVRKSKIKHSCKEALLVIRGTNCTLDWSINMDEVGLPFTFSKGPLTSARSTGPTCDLKPTTEVQSMNAKNPHPSDFDANNGDEGDAAERNHEGIPSPGSNQTAVSG
jgi:hypothetical protein